MSAARVDEAFRSILAGEDFAQPLGAYVEAFVDIERPRGRLTRVSAILADPEPDVGHPRPVIKSVRAVRDDGVIVPITTEEVRALADRFERAYYRWRDRGVRKS